VINNGWQLVPTRPPATNRYVVIAADGRRAISSWPVRPTASGHPPLVDALSANQAPTVSRSLR
jgi:hypothetical protein